MPVFLVDANLPFRVNCWSSASFLHVLKINPEWNDDEIWNYARENNLIIITKDKDFVVKQILEGAPPKLVHIKLGNLKLGAFVNRIEAVWQDVEALLHDHYIINIYINKIEAIR